MLDRGNFNARGFSNQKSFVVRGLWGIGGYKDREAAGRRFTVGKRFIFFGTDKEPS
jgi:hypothetical protein